MDPALRACLLSILQRGITEARACALTGDPEKAAQLLDALDNIPAHLHRWQPDSEQQIALQLEAFLQVYPDHETDYLRILQERTDLFADWMETA